MADLFVASGGGHLAQLYRLVERLPQPSEKRTWITFDTPQSRSLLAGQDVRYIPYTGSRAYMQTVRNSWRAHDLMRDGHYQRVISTGAAPALSFLPVARLHRVEPIYIESAARGDGPSLTGDLLSQIPGIHLYTQYEHWANRKWRYAGSVFDNFEAAPLGSLQRVERIVVTLGTIGGFGFARLVKRLIGIIPAEVSVVWQVGSTDARELPIDGIVNLPSKKLDEEMKRADVVVAHAGVGSALAALDAGRCPVLVPREHVHGEHVDDHQKLIAAALDRRGLAIHRSVESLTYDDLKHAASQAVRATADVPRLCLPATGQTPPRRKAAIGVR
jgi:UDP-N-acetylglucosamine--N-acetylmuramyl-(pentapeptide) pyrophosphoryl-undecaprenol N-acetylglucosamine transferase